MVTGLDNTKVKKKPWKTRMERDIILNKDIAEAYYQKGKVMGNIANKVVNKPKKKKEKDKRNK
jgi:hypothetical protein